MGSEARWEAVRERLAPLIARRDALLEETAEAWAAFARTQGWSASDVACLWEGLTEDLVRRCGRGRPGLPAPAARREVVAVMLALRGRILARLGEGRARR